MYNYPTPKYTPDVKILILEETYWETAQVCVWGADLSISHLPKAVTELLCKGVCRLLLLVLEAHNPKNEKPRLSLHNEPDPKIRSHNWV